MHCLTSERRAPWPCLAVAIAAAAACGAAKADDPSPYFIGVTQTFTHDSNVYRVPDGAADNYASTGLVGGFDQRIGRQRVFGNASVQLNKYQNQSNLDNTSFSLSGGLDFATIERFTGGLSVAANQSLASANDSNTQAPTTERNIVQTEQFGARIGWGGEAPLTLNGAYSRSQVHYSAAAYQTSESNQDSISVGANYRVGATLGVGAALRWSRTVSPKGTLVAPGVFEENTANGQSIDLSADWRPTAQTTTSARIGWTKQSNSRVGDRDFSGLTGAVNASYAPTAKLAFSAALSRDTGTNSSLFNLTNANTGAVTQGLSESSQVTNSVSVNASYAATAKIGLTAGAQWRRSNLVDSFAVAGPGSSNERTDDAKSVSLGINYAIARAWSLGCNLAYTQRDVSGNAVVAAFAYSAKTASCTAQFTLR